MRNMKDALAFIILYCAKNEKRASEPDKFKDAIAFNENYSTPCFLFCQVLFSIFLRQSDARP